VVVVQTDAATRCSLHGHYLLSPLPQSLTLKDPQSRQPLFTWPYPFLRKFGQDQPLTLPSGTVFSFEAGRRSDSGEGTFTFSTPRALELCRAVAAAIACQQQGKDTSDARLFCVTDPQLSAPGLESQSWGPGAEEPQPSPPLGGAQPASHAPASLLHFPPPEPEATGPIVYASIARGQQHLFAPVHPGSSEPWAPGKLPPEHLYENIFATEPGPAGAEEEEEE
ncbi:Docking protein 3, partial [Leptosomus discolor]